jgi:hypothetical protein
MEPMPMEFAIQGTSGNIDTIDAKSKNQKKLNKYPVETTKNSSSLSVPPNGQR